MFLWPASSVTLAVSRAVVKKMAVAIRDRGERRERPQSMWPDVQPRPFYSFLMLVLALKIFQTFLNPSNGDTINFITFVPQPNKKPTPNVDAMEARVSGAAGYDGSSDGAHQDIGTALDTRPAMMGRFFQLGLNTLPAMSEEMPKTAPLCSRRPDEPWKRSRAPREV